MRRGGLFLCLVLVGCAPATGDPLTDYVARQVAPFSRCVTVGQARIFQDSTEPGPPAMLTPQSIRDSDVRAAAATIAIPWQAGPRLPAKVLGMATNGDCAARVDKPAYAGNHAFVGFSEPGGRIGAFAFRRTNGAWKVVERANLGFW